MALRLEDSLREQAKERMLAGVKVNPTENLPEGGETREAIADIAGVSGRTIDKVKTIQREAIPEAQEMARHGGISIHAA